MQQISRQQSSDLEIVESRSAEKLKRRQGRTSLQSFIEYTQPRWQASKPHKIICETFERVERGEIDRVIITIPPQFGKSSIASIGFPAYTLGHDMTHDVVSISSGVTLAQDFGREVRNMIDGQECQNIFPHLKLADDKKAAGRWKTDAGGSYYAVGIGGSLYGRGATRAIIDDPFGSWEDAQSDLKREKVWEWYTGTLYNRVRPGGAIILIQQRMHEADLAGRLIETMKSGGEYADQWTIVELPALNEAGEALWPERYTVEYLKRIKANTSPIKWSSLYMQKPMPEEGTFFQRDWFEFFDPDKLKNVHKYMTSDFAVTEDDGDYTEIATHGYNSEYLYLALDGWFGQTSADVWIDHVIDQMLQHRPLCFFGETGVIRRAVEPFMIRRMQERKCNCRREWLPRPHDKPTMARGLQGLCAMKRVKIADTEYGHRLLRQMLNFPGGQLDDAVDMAALMGMAIDQAHPAVIAPPEPELEPGKDYKFVDDEDEVKGWRVA